MLALQTGHFRRYLGFETEHDSIFKGPLSISLIYFLIRIWDHRILLCIAYTRVDKICISRVFLFLDISVYIPRDVFFCIRNII